jgi:predicted MFS family arabinose efflux permease
MAAVKPEIHDADLVDNNEAALAEKKDSHSSERNEQREAPADAANTQEDRQFYEKYGTYDRYELTEEDCYDELGFSFPTWKKWMILSIVFLVQVSMNFNTSLYSNAVPGISEEFNVSQQAARVGAAIFLITYAFGCELWAPWSEELGRWPVLQLSMFFVNIWQIPVGIAPNFATIIVCRALGGLSTAGGSVTLAMVADMWQADEQQYAVAFIVFSSVGGSVLGPIVGGFVEQFLAWRWNIWIQLIFGGAVQLAHLFLVPETRTTVLMNRIAKKRRAQSEKDGKSVRTHTCHPTSVRLKNTARE